MNRQMSVTVDRGSESSSTPQKSTWPSRWEQLWLLMVREESQPLPLSGDHREIRVMRYHTSLKSGIT